MVRIYSIYLLGIICIAGIIFGLRQYLYPEKVVNKRYSKHKKLAVETGDKEFQQWLKSEFNTQVKRTKRVGIMLASFEAIFLILVVYYLANKL